MQTEVNEGKQFKILHSHFGIKSLKGQLIFQNKDRNQFDSSKDRLEPTLSLMSYFGKL